MSEASLDPSDASLGASGSGFGDRRDSRGIVVFKNGAVFLGQVVELVEDDHVTVRLPDGQVVSFPWDLIKSVNVPHESSEATPPAAGGRLPEKQAGARDGGSPRAQNQPPGTADDDLTEPPSLAPRLASGLQAGYGTPLGPVGLDVDFYPWSWLGLEVAAGLPVLGAPPSFSEGLIFNWPVFSMNFEMGLGVAVAQRLVPPANGSGGLQVINFVEGDCSHFTYYATRSLAFRVSLGITLPLGDFDICDQNPNACPHVTPVSGTGTILWNFDLGSNPG
ncbi:MAG: hypothetical protein JST54_33920 [Deltaproteobacteria bacterium]|nr:hypothetical protein [Deltaproteobacteria bacterium]